MTAALSVMSFTLAAVACWRSGGRGDAAKLRREVEVLRAKQNELVESASDTVEIRYERSRQRLQSTRETLRRLKNEVREGLQTRLRRAEEQLEALTEHLEAAAKAAKESALCTARKLEGSIRRRVHRIEARARLIEAWDRAALAVTAADKKDFDRSEQLLEDAARFLQRACQILEEDGDYDEQIDAARKQLRTATIAVRGRAADARQKIEQAVTETDRVVSALEGDEDKAAEQTQDPAASCEKLKTNRNYQEPAPQ